MNQPLDVAAVTLIRKGLRGSVALRVLTIIFLAVAAALPVGIVIGGLGFIYGSAVLIALAGGYLMLRSTQVGLIALIGIICLLPFAVIPIDIGFSPTFLDVVLITLYFTWISRIATHRETEFYTDPPTLPLLIFVGLAIASFVLGLSNARLTSNLLRHFAEIILGLLLFVLVINTIHDKAQLKLIVRILLLAGTLAALVGIALYFMPTNLAIRLLSLLRYVRYPAGPGVLRYIEDNPELALRATSTSVDPNVLGGLVIFIISMAASQAMADRPIIPRWMAYLCTVILGICLILTYSRGSFVGTAAAMLCLAIRYPRKALWVMAAGVILLLLPPAQTYLRHFISGLQRRDLATQMRMGEYKDALRLIERYPWFGVGFGGTPDRDLYLGVSNVYMLIASETGITGLLAFLVTLVAFFIRFLTLPLRQMRGSELEPIALGTVCAVLGGMVGGIFDHYLFNLVFPHATSLLWLTVGLGAVSFRLIRQEVGAKDALPV
ncbi:MAG: hypothetical protein GXY52_02015 [Chloroflexi bacterium]|nr:hypothetical protein [Chloroflexota bacterium]